MWLAGGGPPLRRNLVRRTAIGGTLSQSVLESHFDEFHSAYEAAIRRRQYPEAQEVCRSYIGVAEQAGDSEAAAMFTGFLATALSLDGRKAEALQALETAERYEPASPHHKIRTAEYLDWALGRPHDGLRKLEEAAPFLSSFGEKTEWHCERGLAALAVGQDIDAVESMRALADPERLSIMHRYISLHYQVDLRLVRRLVERGLATAECIAYLEVAEAVGSRSNEPQDKSDVKLVREMLAKARAGA